MQLEDISEPSSSLEDMSGEDGSQKTTKKMRKYCYLFTEERNHHLLVHNLQGNLYGESAAAAILPSHKEVMAINLLGGP